MIKHGRIHLLGILLSALLIVAGSSGPGMAQSGLPQGNSGYSEMIGKSLDRFLELREKAQEGDASAQHRVGMVYTGGGLGYGINYDLHEAMKWFKLAIEQDYVETQYLYGLLYARGRWDDKQDLPGIVAWFLYADLNEEYETHNLVEELYNEGAWENGQDISKALEWFGKAAKQDHVKAQFNLGVMHYAGNGTPRDYSEALKWFERAAGQDDKVVQFTVAYMYENGQGASRNSTKAIEWYKRAGEQGLLEAQATLGSIYTNAKGTPRNDVEAFKWYKMAAEKETKYKNENDIKLIASMRFNIAEMYATGKGTAQDYGHAIKWYERAAENCYPTVAYRLGKRYESGDAVPHNKVEAYKWYAISVACGDDGLSRKSLDAVSGDMTSAQMSEAQALVADWIEKHSK